MANWLKLHRLFKREDAEHFYTTRKDELDREGYVDEGIVCRLLPPKEGRRSTVPLLRYRPEGSPDYVLTVDLLPDKIREQAVEMGYVYTARRWGTVPLYELFSVVRLGPRNDTLPHFYTSDRAEAERAVAQHEFGRHRAICHVMPPPIERRLWRWIIGLGVLELVVVLLAARFGDGHNPLQQIASAWVLIAGVAAVGAFLLGVAVGKRPPV